MSDEMNTYILPADLLLANFAENVSHLMLSGRKDLFNRLSLLYIDSAYKETNTINKKTKPMQS